MENNNLSSCSKVIDKANTKIKKLIDSIVDKQSFVETDVFLTGKGFDSAFEALGEGVVTGYATISGTPIHLFAQNSEVFKGSFSEAQAKKIIKSMQRAIDSGTPFVSIVDSCGARIGEGAGIMESYAQLIAKGIELSSEVPHICILNGVAVGMMATFVAGADFVFMADSAFVSVNSPAYLLSQTTDISVDFNKILGFKNYEKSCDMAQFSYADAKDLKEKMTKLINVIMPNEEEGDDEPNRVSDELASIQSAQERTNIICDAGTVVEYSANYASEVKCSLAKLNGISVGVVATEGEYLSEKGLEKATSFISLLDGYDLPLITLVDTLGLNSNKNEETNGIAKKAYALMKEISNASVAKIGVAVGNSVGFGYSALMSKALGFGYTLAVSNAVVAPVASSAGIYTFMDEQIKKSGVTDKIKAKLEAQYNEIIANPMVAAKDGFIDNVINASDIRPYVASALLMLLGI